MAFGLGTLIAVSELAFNILKWCGALYLCWLGIQMILRPHSDLTEKTSSSVKTSNWFIKGMLGNVLNPKMGVFYVSFLPQFIPQGHSAILWTFSLVMIHVLLGTLWSISLIYATRPLSHILRRENVIKWMNRVTGGLFLLFAVKLVLSRR
ncbi:lysine transporter LysE [Xenorhabdus beddingii]|uniref:Lysine transporter LysE n=1 Tax=Xenorhabdus beddingii TaxID=40578 RepID=A0A1Y2SBP2_9GAMM|nr:lysine transporter LysE [Xenorhabdus beddingii]